VLHLQTSFDFCGLISEAHISMHATLHPKVEQHLCYHFARTVREYICMVVKGSAVIIFQLV